MIRWGPALGLVDIPNSRKVHTRPIPKGGGPAIFVGWLFGTQCVGIDFEDLCIWGGIGLLIVVLGLVDDLRPLPWQLRLAVQFIAAIAAVFMLSGLQVNNPSSLDPFLFWPLAVFWIVGLTNAFNMLDNMDALSAGVAWFAAALFALAGASVFPHLLLMGSLTGFLLLNRPPARIFMGDAGSTFLGFFFGTGSLRFAGERPNAWALILCFLTIPWYDLISVVTIRLRQGRSPFHADKQHLSHRLVALGLSGPQAVGIICLLALGIGAGGLILFRIGEPASRWIWFYLAGCWLTLGAFECLTRKKRQPTIDPS
jgi:UDP-GlcNAc:undecaprenyl-phosphate/decaprenyl-phosphate GlcNAc-1-phosphate transferase